MEPDGSQSTATAGGGVSVRLVGDNVAIGHPGGLAFFYQRIASELAPADIRFGNLEWPITDGPGEDPATFGRPPGHMLPDDAQALATVGFDVVSVANNHIMDRGPDAMLRTLHFLDAHGIAHCGAGPTAAEAHRPAIVLRNRVRIAFLAYTAVFIESSHPIADAPDRPQMATFRVDTSYDVPHKLFEQPGTPPVSVTTPRPDDVATLEADIRAARAISDAVVVSWHWGVSGGFRNRVPYQAEVGHRCIDAGASVVVGHHPHVLQGVERYNGGLICYSLGNFVFWRYRKPPIDRHDPYSFIVDARLGAGGLESAALVPVNINDEGQPEPATAEQAVTVWEAVRRESRAFATDLRLRDGRIEVEA
jgi:poly-gamma-glutamate capsule biosynthesis protein CapA/YwtB (metallophosphatase superfamily)